MATVGLMCAGWCAGSGGCPAAEVGGAAPGGGDQDAEGAAAAGTAQAAGWLSLLD